MVRSVRSKANHQVNTTQQHPMEHPTSHPILSAPRERQHSLESTITLLNEYSLVDRTADSNRTSVEHQPSNISQTSKQLPEYSCVSPQGAATFGLENDQTHTFHLDDDKDTTWVMLDLRSDSASRQSLPQYGDDEHITGSVKLRLPSAQTIHSISLQVRP